MAGYLATIPCTLHHGLAKGSLFMVSGHWGSAAVIGAAGLIDCGFLLGACGRTIYQRHGGENLVEMQTLHAPDI